MPGRKFGRIVRFDARSRDYPIKRLTDGRTPISKEWFCSKVLNQGDDPYCVGFGCAHELIAEPTPCLCVDGDYAIFLYGEAQKNDEWPGQDYEGSSVLGGTTALRNLGWCDEFRWSFSHVDTQLGIGYEGPGIAGTNWYTGMGQADSNGFIHVTGYIEGGHCYLFLGVNVEEEHFIILNSWGKWGINGTGKAKISFSDYEKLRTANGEMAFLVGRHDMCGLPPPQPPPEPNAAAKRVERIANMALKIVCPQSEVKVGIRR